MKNRNLLKSLTVIFRVILGITFVFSGFVKAVDPYGFALKIQEHLLVFHLDIFSFLSMPASLGLCALELVSGLLLLLGLFPKWTSRIILLIMVFMTILTFYLALTNPVGDCGCFGDVIILTNWETFIKNIFLLVFAVFLFFHYNLITPLFTSKSEKWVLAYIVIFTSGLLFVSYYYDNVADFRAYGTGADLPEKMIVEESKKPIEQIYFIYERDGEKKEFDSGNYPWQDTSWTFVERITKVIEPGHVPEISDFSIGQYIFNDEMTRIVDQINITDEVLHDTNYVFLMIAPFLTEIKGKDIIKFVGIAEYASKYGYPFFCLTSSLEQDIVATKNGIFPQMNFCGTDQKALQTIIRSTPGLMLLKKGIIIHKWSRVLLPSPEELGKPLQQLKFSKTIKASKKNARNILVCLLLLIIPLAGIKSIEIFKSSHLN